MWSQVAVLIGNENTEGRKDIKKKNIISDVVCECQRLHNERALNGELELDSGRCSSTYLRRLFCIAVFAIHS